MSTATMIAPDRLDHMDMTEAIAATWEAIRHQVPDVPRVVTVSIVAGRVSPHHRPDRTVLHVAESTVDAGAPEILAFVLHHAAHDLSTVPTQGSEHRYHGEDFKAAAERLQLRVSYIKGNGWSRTEITAAHVTIYEPQLEQLAAARSAWTPSASHHEGRNGIVAECQCHPARRIRIRGAHAAEELAAHPVLCSLCGEPFVPVPPGRSVRAAEATDAQTP
jgi:hypothetical protein